MRPEVSVIMAVHNGERFLSRAVRSILEQDFEDFEFIIVDDASTDSTPQILAGLGDPRLRLLRNEQNMGLTKSLNRALEFARGNLVARQDADDLSEPERLARQVRYMSEHPRTLVVGTWALEVDEIGQVVGELKHPAQDPDIRWRLLLGNAFVHTSVVFRRLTPDAGAVRYDESLRYSQDYELWSRLAGHGRLANIPEHLVRLRRHPGQISAEKAAAQNEAARRIALANIRRLTADSPSAQLLDRVRARTSPWRYCREDGYEGAELPVFLCRAYREKLGAPPEGQMDLCAREIAEMLAVAFEDPCDSERCADILLKLTADGPDRPWLMRHLGRYVCEQARNTARLNDQVAQLEQTRRELLGEISRLRPYEESYNRIINKPAVRAYRHLKGFLRRLVGSGSEGGDGQ